jgi:hypothetical protein
VSGRECEYRHRPILSGGDSGMPETVAAPVRVLSEKAGSGAC